MRRLVVTLLLGVAFLLSSAGAQQTPVVYTSAGEALIELFGSRSEGFWQERVMRDDYLAGVDDLILTFQGADGTPYWGGVRVSDSEAFRNYVIDYFYYYTCQTSVLSDCGLLRRPGEKEKPSSGTSLDAFMEQVGGSLGLSFSKGNAWWTVRNSPPGPEWIWSQYEADFECRRPDDTVRQWVSVWYKSPSSGSSVRYTAASRPNVGFASLPIDPSDSRPTTLGDASAAYNSALQNFQQYCPPVTLKEWFAGTYISRGNPAPTPAPHPDTPEGLRIIALQVLADLERSHGFVVLPDGLSWDPAPTEMQLGGDPDTSPPGSDPGGSGGDGQGPDYADAPIEDGCNVLNIPCNLRRLFVPTEDFGARAEELKATAEGRFPFSLGVGTIFENFKIQFFDGWDPETDCPSFGTGYWQVLVELLNTVPNDGTPGSENYDMQLCTAAPVTWMHEYGRPFLVVMVYLAGLMFAFRRVFGGGA